MKRCSKHCIAVCDYCRLYNYNGDEKGVYWGTGYCVWHEKAKQPYDTCNDFICDEYKNEDERIRIKLPKQVWDKWIEAQSEKNELSPMRNRDVSNSL